jgi:hypothetical protein
MDWEGFVAYVTYDPVIFQAGLRKTENFRLTGFQTEIWTTDFLKTKQEFYSLHSRGLRGKLERTVKEVVVVYFTTPLGEWLTETGLLSLANCSAIRHWFRYKMLFNLCLFLTSKMGSIFICNEATKLTSFCTMFRYFLHNLYEFYSYP